MAAEFSVDGIEELIAKLETAGQNVNKASKEALIAAAEPIAADMRSSVALSKVDHVHIRDDIEISEVKTKDGIKYVTVGPVKTAWRAKFLEWGTSKMRAIPFVQPAGEKNAASTLRIIAEVLRGFLRL